MIRFNPITFALAFSITYAATFWFALPMFLFYPQTGLLHFGWTPVTANGPGMAWYGLMADSFLVAVVTAFVIPDRIFDRPLTNFLWVVPVLSMLVILYLLRSWFLMT